MCRADDAIVNRGGGGALAVALLGCAELSDGPAPVAGIAGEVSSNNVKSSEASGCRGHVEISSSANNGILMMFVLDSATVYLPASVTLDNSRESHEAIVVVMAGEVSTEITSAVDNEVTPAVRVDEGTEAVG